MAAFTKGGVSLLLLASISVLARPEAGAAPPSAEPVTRTFKVAKGGNLLILPIDIGAGRYPFALDTGSTVSSFDISLQPLLRGRTGTTHARTQNGTRDMDSFAAPPMSVGGALLEGIRNVLCIDYDAVRKVAGEAICGLIGMDALKTHIVQIDFDRGELSFLDSLPENAGEQFPLTYVLGVPSVCLSVNQPAASDGNEQTHFWVDTGCCSVCIEPHLFDSLIAEHRLTLLGKEPCVTVTGRTEVRTGKLADLRLGPFQHASLRVSEGSINSLSLDYLSRYRVTFDFPNDRLYLLPGERFQEADLPDLSGMHLIRVGGDTKIASLDSDGAAHRAGLAVGDVILDIGGTPAPSLSMVELSRIFAKPATRSITVRRGQFRMRLLIELDEKSEKEAVTGGDSGRARSSQQRSGDVKRLFKIAKHGNPILLPIDIGSERHMFLFDTGTAITSFDVSLKRLLLGRSGSRKEQSQFNRKGADTELFIAPRLLLGGNKLRGISEVTCVDQAALRSELGEDFDGVLGMDAIDYLTVQIDFDRGELSVLPSVPEDAGELIPRVLVGGVPAIQLGEVGEDPGYFLIDTGYISVGSGSLRSLRFRSLLESGQASLIATRPTATVVRPTASSEAKLAQFDSEHKDLVFQEGALNALSLSYLSRYLVTLDLGQIYLKRAERYNCPELHDLSGMKLSKRAGEVVVESFEQNSVGERAGLCPGDAIVEIDGIAANTITLLDLRRMLAEPSTRSLTVRRGIATEQVKVELRDGAAR